MWVPSMAERVGNLTSSQSEVSWVINPAGRPAGLPNPKKPTVLREAAGVWNRESGDRIRGCNGACIHVVELPRRSRRLEHNQGCSPSSFPPQIFPQTGLFTTTCIGIRVWDLARGNAENRLGGTLHWAKASAGTGEERSSLSAGPAVMIFFQCHANPFLQARWVLTHPILRCQPWYWSSPSWELSSLLKFFNSLPTTLGLPLVVWRWFDLATPYCAAGLRVRLHRHLSSPFF